MDKVIFENVDINKVIFENIDSDNDKELSNKLAKLRDAITISNLKLSITH